MKFMDRAKSENKKIGILGGTFDPSHIGHVKISKVAKKKFNLDQIVWAVTKKNPFKNKGSINLKKRIKFANELNLKNKFIKVECFEDHLKSNRTIDLIKYLKKKNKNSDLFFIMGADNLINFHKWDQWKKIALKCHILVFDRNKYKSKSLKSVAYKKFRKKGLDYINFKKINISSSKLRKI